MEASTAKRQSKKDDAKTMAAPPAKRDPPNQDPGHHDELPEKKLNTMALRMAFFLRLMSGCGGLALVWATVVLLGGFSTLIEQRDFWFVTVIVFMETTWLFNTSKPEDQFYVRLPETMMKAEKIADLGRGSWRRHITSEESFLELLPELIFDMKSNACSRCFCFGFLFQSFLAYGQLAANIACIVMSSLRLKRQDYVDPIYQHSDDHKNIRWSLNIFYGLALSQCVIYFLTGIVANPMGRIFNVFTKYNLGVWGVPALARYVQECLLKCINGDLRGVVNMDLVSFAKELSNSDSLGDQVVGLRILDYLLRNKDYQGNVHKKIRASSDTVEKAVYILGLKTDVNEDSRGHAGRILLELAEDLQVNSFPGILHSISSLLSANKRSSSGAGSTTKQLSVKEFTSLGVDILEKLVHDPDNCAQVKDAENLLFQIIGLTNCHKDSLDSTIDKMIVENSLKVLHKLVSTAGTTGDELRCQVSKNVHIIANIRKILIDYAESHPQMLVQAVGILACLALDDTARKEIGQKRQIIRNLICLLAGEIDAVQDCSIRTLAAEALVLLSAPVEAKSVLSTASENRVQAILAETTVEDMERIVRMLSDQSAEHRTMVAKLLQNLRTYQGPEYADQLKRIDQALPTVLEATLLAVEKIEKGSSNDEFSAHEMEQLMTAQGILLESFIGLCVQICTISQGNEFDSALKSVKIRNDILVMNLKKILDVYNAPTADYPGIRRVVVQQLNWMMENDKRLISVFLKHDMDKTLKMVVETASKLEDFWLFRSGVGAFEHQVTISSLLSTSPILQACGSVAL